MSAVWQFFKKKSGTKDDGDAVSCQLCKATLKQTMGSTSSMLRHLVKIHPKKWQEKCGSSASQVHPIKANAKTFANLQSFANEMDDTSIANVSVSLKASEKG